MVNRQRVRPAAEPSSGMRRHGSGTALGTQGRETPCTLIGWGAGQRGCRRRLQPSALAPLASPPPSQLTGRSPRCLEWSRPASERRRLVPTGHRPPETAGSPLRGLPSSFVSFSGAFRRDWSWNKGGQRGAAGTHMPHPQRRDCRAPAHARRRQTYHRLAVWLGGALLCTLSHVKL